MPPGQTLRLSYTLRARFPSRAQAPASRAYPYYNPDQAAIAPPQETIGM
ncbi:MAG TPA: hypothetical protein VFJ58_14580 [Armatimonadota bacterium]|nr:hypothetical protein [Armatimonadota bacterium]